MNIYTGHWGLALGLVPGMVFFSGLAWWAFSGTCLDHRANPEQGSGSSEAGKPVTVGPKSPHHLIAAKDLPPADKTHSYPHD